MPADKRRKLDDEGRAFNNEWCTKYFVVQYDQGVVCLLCQNTIAVMKEYNVRRHYMTQHSSQLHGIVGQARVDLN